MHHSIRFLSKQFQGRSVTTKLILLNLIFIIPLSGMMLYNYVYLKDGVKHQVLQANESFMNQMSDSLFKDWDEIRYAINDLGIDPETKLLSNYSTSIHSYYGILLAYKEKIKAINIRLPFRSEIYVYLPNKDLVVGADGTRDLKVFYSSIALNNNDVSCDCYHQSDELEKLYTLDKTILYSYRLFPEGYIFVQIAKKELQFYLNNMTKLQDNIILLANQSNRVAVSTATLSEDSVKQLLEQPAMITMDSTKYTSLWRTNGFFRIATLFSESVMQERLGKANGYAIVFFLVFLIVNLCFLFANWSIIFRPLRRITRTFTPFKMLIPTKNEFAIITDTITQLNTATLYMQQTLSDQSSIMEHNALLRLLIDPDHTISSDILHALQEKFNSYVVLAVVEENRDGEQQSLYTPILNQELSPSVNFIRLYTQMDMTIFIAECLNELELAQTISALLDNGSIEENLVLCGISTVHSNLQEIGFALQDAQDAIYNHVVSDIHHTKQVLLHRPQHSEKEPYSQLSVEKEQELVNYTVKGNEDAVTQFFDNTLNHSLKTLTFEQIRTILRHLYDLLMVICNSKNIQIEKLWATPPNFSKSFHLSYLFEQIRFGYLSAARCSVRVSTPLYEQIKEYINKHYANPDLSLTLIADYFSITHVYLSTYFKKQSGHNFIYYLHYVRIMAAIQLMQTSPDLTMKDVSEKVGYTNAGTFIRQFKKLSGTTPTQHVKLEES